MGYHGAIPLFAQNLVFHGSIQVHNLYFMKIKLNLKQYLPEIEPISYQNQ